MADNPGLDFLRDVAKNAGHSPVSSPRADVAEAPPDNEGTKFLRQVAAPPTSGGEPGSNSFEGSPVISPLPATIPQQMASPIVKGVSAVGDLGNLIAGAAAHGSALVDPYNLFLTPNDQQKQVLQQRRDLGNRLLENTGSKGSIYNWARQLGVVPEEEEWSPTSWLGRAMHDTTNLATQFVTGGGFGRLLRGASGAVEGAANTLGTPVRTALARPTTTWFDASLAPVGGAAGATAHALGGNRASEDTAMAVGSMTPIIGRALVPRALVDITEHAFNFFKKPGDSETGKRLAGLLGKSPRELLDEFTTSKGSTPLVGPPAPPNLPNIEGWSPSPGAMTGNTALLGQERKAADNAMPFGDPLNPGQQITPGELRQRNALALQEELKSAGPQGDPRLATEQMRGRIEGVQGQAQRRAGQLNTEAEALESAAQQAQRVVEAQMPSIAPGERTGARAAAANRFHGALEDAEQAATVQGGRLFDAVDPDKAATVPMYRLRDALEEVRATAVERGRMDALPSVMVKPKDAEGALLGDKVDDFLHNFPAEEPKPQFLANVPYERVKGLRSRLTTLQRDATDPQQREFYGKLIGGVDNAVAESKTGGLAERYAVARDFWRTNVAEPFREGPVANILKNDKNYTGASQLLAPGERGGQNIQQIVPTIRRDPQLYQATVDHARADMVATTTDVNGRVNGAKLKEWVDKHQPVLQHFPELQTEFTRLAQAQRTADQYLRHAEENSPVLRALAERGIKNTEDTIRNSAARFYLNAEPEDVVRALASLRGSARAKAAQQAMAMLKTPEAKEGLQRAYYDYIQKRVLGGENRETVKGNWKSGFTSLLDNEADIANVLLTPAVRSRLKSLDKALHAEGARQNARANDGARTAEDMMTKMVNGLRENLPTVGGGATAGAVVGSAVPIVGTGVGAAAGAAGAYAARRLVLARINAQEAALREAIFDPKIYERVMSNSSLDPVTRRMMNKAVRPYLIIANTEAVADRAKQ